MVNRLGQTVRLAVFGLLATAAWQPAAAEIYNYEGTIFFCTPTCNSFAALGAPDGGVTNTTASTVSGFIEIDVEPNGSFTEADIVDFSFAISNESAPQEDAVFDGSDFLNPTSANPLPLDNRVVTFDEVPGYPFGTAIFGGSGTTGPNNELVSGQLVATFTVPPFNNNGGQVYFDMSNSVPTEGYLFGGVIKFTEIDGTFSQLPGAISVTGNPTVFDDTPLGATSAADVTVTNTGDGPLTISSVATNDTLDAPFSIADDGCSGMTLASSANCVIAIEFSPVDMGGSYTDSFDIVSNDPDTASVTIDVSGTALEPNIVVSPVPLAFVATTVGDTSRAVATVRNTGDGDLVIETIDFTVLDAQFSAEIDDCSMATLVPDGSCQITMEFAPAGEGIFTTGFDIPSNDPDSPSFSYELEGEGIIGTVAAVTATPAALSFDEILVGQMSELAVQVNSTGNDPLTINSIALSGTDVTDFSQTNDCPASLPSGENCVVTVVFEPMSGGAKSAVLTIDSDANNRPILEVLIDASAFEGPRIVVEPAELDLGSPSAPIDVGNSTTADVTVSNTGTSDLTVGSLIILDVTRGGTVSTEFTVDNNGCTMPVAPEGSCMITVRFSPLTDADKSAQLDIQSDDADNPVTSVSLTGYVFRGPRVDVPDTTIDVDGGTSIETGETTDFDLTVANSGTEDLDITGFALGGEDADEFSFVENCVGTPVAPAGSCVVTITFAPTSAGEKSAELSIFSNDVTLVRAATIVVTLSATATAPVVIPPAAPGSQTVQPPPFALSDPGGGSLGVGLLGLGLIMLIARRRYR